MPNTPYTAASKYFGCFLLAISIKPQSQPQCIWETWRTGLMKVAHLSFSRVGLRPLLLCTRQKDQSGDGALGIIPASVLLLQKEQEQWWLVLLGWATQCSDHTSQTGWPSMTPASEIEAMAMLLCLLPTFFPCPPQMRLALPELKAKTTTKTFRNFWMAKEKYIETDDLQIEPPEEIVS